MKKLIIFVCLLYPFYAVGQTNYSTSQIGNYVYDEPNTALKTIDSGSGLSIAKGDVDGYSFIHKFGAVPDFDTADAEVTVWDGADDGGIDEMDYTYSATAAIDSLSSSDNGDTQDISVQGLDSNYDLVTQTITLTGQTRKALDTDLILSLIHI